MVKLKYELLIATSASRATPLKRDSRGGLNRGDGIAVDRDVPDVFDVQSEAVGRKTRMTLLG